MDKTELRAEAERVRAALILSGEEGEHAAQMFLNTLQPQAGQVVSIYWPIRRELDTFPLIEELHHLGVRTALPVTRTDDKTLDFIPYDGRQTLVPGPYGIPQPTGTPVLPDIIVLPLLAFDRKGYRLGYGGGHYDRTLAKLQQIGHNVITVGYAYAEQICLFPLPRDDHDWRLDLVITPQNAHDFRG